MSTILHNDEGMWLLNKLPVERLKQLYGFEPTDEWCERVQKASVRMNNGGSASFVSPLGLIATNCHVAQEILHDLSSSTKDYMRDGFYASTIEQEVLAPQLEVNVLWKIEDVTNRVTSAIKKSMSPVASMAAKRAMIAKIEKEAHDATGLRCNVITLYQGGAYHLYRYKKYTDVRLVFAPEHAIAKFGDDIDNYEYPRFALDVSFLRVYENGKPLHTDHFFKWSDKNSYEGDLLFVSGHPGSTDRLSTIERILSLRDSGLPYDLAMLYRQEINLQQFANRSKENKRIASHELYHVQNLRKRFLGRLTALQDPTFITRKMQIEKKLRYRVVTDAHMQESYGDAWEMIARAEEKMQQIQKEKNLFDSRLPFNTLFFRIAQTIVRLADEDAKPNHKRLPEYRDPGRDSLLDRLFSPAPIYKNFEQHMLADALSLFAETLGCDHTMIKKILAGKNPKARAQELIAGTTLDDIDARKYLVTGGKKTVMQSQDAFIALARLVDAHSRKIRKIFETEIHEVREQAYAKIAKAQFELYGQDVYPDATFTLRIAFGRALGYIEEGISLPYATSIGDTFGHADHHENKEPWKLPESWLITQWKLCTSDKNFNIVTTHDTHGGNSGSPVFDVDCNIVGLLFDGNIYENSNHFMYTDKVERSISVHTAGITEVLRHIYFTERLLQELLP